MSHPVRSSRCIVRRLLVVAAIIGIHGSLAGQTPRLVAIGATNSSVVSEGYCSQPDYYCWYGTVDFLVGAHGWQQTTIDYTVDCGPFKMPAWSYYPYSYPPACYQTGVQQVTFSGTTTITVALYISISNPFSGTVSIRAWPDGDTTKAVTSSATASMVFNNPPWLVLTAPTTNQVTITPATGTTVGPTASIAVDWCSRSAPIRDVVFQGQHLPDSYVAFPRSVSCPYSGYSLWNMQMPPWQQTIVATQTGTNGDTTRATSTLTYSPPIAQFQPTVTPKFTAVYARAGSARRQTFTITNSSYWPAVFTLAPDCGTMTGCSLDRNAVTLDRGASDSVTVFYTAPPSAGVMSTVKLTARYTAPTGATVADVAQDTVYVPASLDANARSLFQPQVIPPNPSTIVIPAGWIGGLEFSVRNLGSAPAAYHLTARTAGGTSLRPGFLPDTLVTVLPGQTGWAMTDPIASSIGGQIGVVTLYATHTDSIWGTVVDSATGYIESIIAQPSVALTPRDFTQIESATATQHAIGFFITDDGNVGMNAILTFQCSGLATNCRYHGTNQTGGLALVPDAPPAPTQIDFDLDSAAVRRGDVGTVKIVLRSETWPSIADSITATVRTDAKYIAVSVSPHASTVTLRPGLSSLKQTMVITNTGTDTSAFSYQTHCTGTSLICATTMGLTPTLVPNQTASVVVDYSTSWNVPATGRVVLAAASVRNAAIADSGSLTVATAYASPIVVHTGTINPGPNVPRNACLTIAAGDAAAYECGDLRVVHGLSVTTTMNEPHAPALIYSSAHAASLVIVAADVAVPVGTRATTLRNTLRIQNHANVVTVTRDLPWDTTWTGGAARRMGIAFSAAASSLPEGAYAYTYEVKALPDSTAAASDTGTLVVVDRSASSFGRGWWLDGLEHISTNTPDTTQRLWIGGDGSTRLYVAVPGSAPRKWAVTPALDRPDTLQAVSGGGYIRWLRDSAHVRFDAFGRQIATVNRQRDSTVFAYNASGGLAWIALAAPAGASGPRYSFTYGASYGVTPLVTRIDAPAVAGVARATTLHYATSSNVITTITDPDATSVSFTADASGRTATRRNRLGDLTTYAYDAAGKLQSATLDLSRTSEQSIVTTFCAAESWGIAACPRAQDPVGVYTLLDGPRTDVDDVTRFYVDRFGAPDTVTDAEGQRTRIVRDAAFPLLADTVIAANGYRTAATYTSRGLIATHTEVAPYGAGNAVTRYVWNRSWDEPDTIIAPTNETMRFGYDGNGDRIWEEDGRGAMSRVQYLYDANRELSAVQPPGNSSSQQYRYAYDAQLGDLASTTTPLGIVTRYHVDGAGRVDSVYAPIDGASVRTRSYAFDLMDRVLVERDSGPAQSYALADAASGTTPALTLTSQNVYDVEGNLVANTRSASPDLGHEGALILRWSYDGAGRKLTATSTSGHQESWQYDPAGNDTAWITRRGDRITSAYDVLNRVVTTTTPSITRAAEIGYKPWEDPNPPPRFPFYGPNHYVFDPLATYPTMPPNLVIPMDTARFAYDGMGRLARAQNAAAIVARAYYPNGALQHDTLKAAVYDGTETPVTDPYGQHVYVLDYAYDPSGRRLSRVDHVPACGGCAQAYAYDGNTGLLSATTDQGSTFGFTYDASGRLVARTTNARAVVDSFAYDLDDRLAHRSVWRTGVPQTVYYDSLMYDEAGRIVQASIGSDLPMITDRSVQAYDGLGALAGMYRTRAGATLVDQMSTDGFGNAYQHFRWTDDQRLTTNLRLSGEALSAVVDSAPAWKAGDPPPAVQLLRSTSNGYDAAGNLTGTLTAALKWTESGVWTPSGVGPEWTWDVYDAAGRLRFAERDMHDATGLRTVFMEYRYDALGRRILMRTRWDPRCVPSGPTCLSSIDRFVWDGDQLLYEMRSTVSPTATGTALESPANNGPFTGTVRYTHAGGIDEPLAIWSSNAGGVVPHRSWRGLYEAGSGVDGSARSDINWPARDEDAFYAKDERITPLAPTNWLGSLVEGKSDPSGLMYMRNRYYDARTGRFTQEDPIGLAGGMNLYGFAGGDPVNFSDPFGLWPCPELCGAGAGGGAGALGGAVLEGVGAGAVAAVAAPAAIVGGLALWASQSVVPMASDRSIPGALVGADATAYRPGGRFSGNTKGQIDRDATSATGQEGTCEYCGITLVPVPGSPNSTEYDHLTPKSKGGSNSPENGRRSCRTCNREMGNKEKSDPRKPPEQQP